jgi:hypothetical protein
MDYMEYIVENPDFKRSPFTGMVRRNWLAAAQFLIDGVFYIGADSVAGRSTKSQGIGRRKGSGILTRGSSSK